MIEQQKIDGQLDRLILDDQPCNLPTYTKVEYFEIWKCQYMAFDIRFVALIDEKWFDMSRNNIIIHRGDTAAYGYGWEILGPLYVLSGRGLNAKHQSLIENEKRGPKMIWMLSEMLKNDNLQLTHDVFGVISAYCLIV